MDAILRLKAVSLNAALIDEIKSQAGHWADIEIKIHNVSDTAVWLSEEQFWALIECLDWNKTGDDDAVTAPLVSALAAMPMPAIYRFQDLLSEKLWLLDTERHAEASIAGEEDYLSSDGFLYDRCCVVANGRDLYEAVLANPEKWPRGLSFEALLSVADTAYKLKTGKKMDYIPMFNYETGSNEEGWK
jgi:hypothetical protein